MEITTVAQTQHTRHASPTIIVQESGFSDSKSRGNGGRASFHAQAQTTVTVDNSSATPQHNEVALTNVETATQQQEDTQAGSTLYADREDSVTLLQTPQQEQLYSQHVIVGQSVEYEETGSKTQRPTSPGSGSVSYTIPAYDDSKEYRELDRNTLRHHYGDVTPFGTFATDNGRPNQRYDTQVRSGASTKLSGRDSAMAKSDDTNFQESFSASLYSSLLRTSDTGAEKVQLNDRSINYVDFLPRKIVSKCCRREYETYRDCVQRANTWLSNSKSADVIRCESVRHRLDHSHRFNPESMTTHDRSYLIGLRLWFKNVTLVGEEDHVTKLAFRNFLPSYLHRDEKKKWKKGDCPFFEDLPQTLEKINKQLQEKPLKGKLLGVETVPVNYSAACNENGSLDTDVAYCCLDFQGHWEFFFVRIFYLENEAIDERPELGYCDFAPMPLTLPPSRVQFQTMSSLISNANRWIRNNSSKTVVGIGTVELPFKIKMLVASKGHVNTNVMCYEPTRSSMHWKTLRVLRLWFLTKSNEVDSQATKESSLINEAREFDMMPFAPRQLTTAGCCGIQKAMFATTRDTVARLNEWLTRTGAEVMCIETDNIEKWYGSSFNLHSILPERTYNKEDYVATVSRSALEYRMTVFRVYYRPKSLQNTSAATPDKPVQPFCCFVGCTVM